MHSKMKWPAVASCLLFLVSIAAAQLPVPTPSPLRSPTPTIPPLPTPTPVAIATPTPPSVANPGEFIPVVITYGDGSQTRAQITRGIMHPVGIPANEPVTVTLFLGS